jgi:hypothetical protein
MRSLFIATMQLKHYWDGISPILCDKYCEFVCKPETSALEIASSAYLFYSFVFSATLYVSIRSVKLTRGTIGSKLTEVLQRRIENHIERDTDAIEISTKWNRRMPEVGRE